MERIGGRMVQLGAAGGMGAFEESTHSPLLPLLSPLRPLHKNAPSFTDVRIDSRFDGTLDE